MGFGGISIWQLLIVLVIVLLLFGTKRLRSLGTDLGNAIKGFRGAMRDGEEEKGQEPEKLEQKPELKPDQKPGATAQPGRTIEGEVASRDPGKDKG